MNTRPCSELYFDTTVITELYWNKRVAREGLGDTAAFTYSAYGKCRSVCSYANQSGFVTGRKIGRLTTIFTSILQKT